MEVGKENSTTCLTLCNESILLLSPSASIDYGFIVFDLHHLSIFTSSAGLAQQNDRVVGESAACW
jgi:hypothetical protein